MNDFDVVVIGAGLSGLVAARDLDAADLRVYVLEARQRVGGRVAKRELPGGATVEIGGEYVGADQTNLYELARSLRVNTFPAYDEGDRVLEHDGRVRRYRGRVPPLGPLALADLGQAVWRLDRMARTLPDGNPWEAANAERWDHETLGAWIRRNARSRRARAIIETGAETIWPLGPEEISLLHALLFIRFAGGLEVLAETSGGAQEERFAGGASALAARLAAGLRDRLELDSPVDRVRWSSEGVRVASGATEYVAAHAILAMSPTLWGRIRFDPPLPPERDQLPQRMPQGAAIKCLAIYDELFWRREGLRGQAISTTGPINVTIDGSPHSGSPGILTGFICGRAARKAIRLPADERRGAVLAAYTRLFGLAAAKPAEYVEQNWSAEPYSRGCYAAAMGPGAWTEFGALLREPLGRLHWAGAETAPRWYGYMEGAVSSGHRVAREIAGTEGRALTKERAAL